MAVSMAQADVAVAAGTGLCENTTFFIIHSLHVNLLSFVRWFWHYISFSFVFYYISINGYANAVRVSALSEMNDIEVDIFVKYDGNGIRNRYQRNP